MEFVKSQTWCEEVARINSVLRPEGPLLPAQAVRPGGRQLARNDAWDGLRERPNAWATVTQASRPGLDESALQAENRVFKPERGFVFGPVHDDSGFLQHTDRFRVG